MSPRLKHCRRQIAFLQKFAQRAIKAINNRIAATDNTNDACEMEQALPKLQLALRDLHEAAKLITQAIDILTE